jgi:hypothetical protein
MVFGSRVVLLDFDQRKRNVLLGVLYLGSL